MNLFYHPRAQRFVKSYQFIFIIVILSVVLAIILGLPAVGSNCINSEWAEGLW
jgi:hypothetical protein